ncbi:response regulator transcription factor [Asanoa sp. NPDC049573]|uniref:response regulator transcription factor n=1 Tax=Asanoa sp. NPDC049573 TaxID=3155396 RepID=UPI0034488229
MTTRVLVVDDQENVRIGFRLILDSQPDMTVVGEAANGDTGLELARHLRPDVVLADIRMPGMDGLELTRRLAGAGPRVIVVTTFDQDDYVTAALRDGACGFLLKRSGPTLLVEAVRAAMAGDTLISPQLTLRLLRRLSTAPPAPTVADADLLTAREHEVVRSVARGSTNAEIAAELSISAGTVKTHVANIQAKLGARNRVGIAAWAWSTGHAV